MPNDERRRVGIPEDYETRDEDVRLSGYSLREDYMCGRIAAGDNRESVLVVCGAVHLPGISERLTKCGYEVEMRDLTAEAWFDPPYKRIIRGEV
jgi:hypothetical protein